MTNKYYDPAAVIQIIGCVYNDPILLDTDKYSIHEYDFIEDFHRIIFGTIYNLHAISNKVTLDAIVDYLENRPKFNAVFKTNKGVDYLLEAAQIAKKETFDYYYGRLKKLTLLRAYSNYGIDVSSLYDPNNVLDIKKRQIQEDWLDNSSISSIVDIIDKKIADIKIKYASNNLSIEYQAGDGISKLIDSLKKCPEIGIPLYGELINTVTRGARLGKLYLRSAATGQGKSRSMIADICYIACDEIYDEQFGWIKNGKAFPSLYISTEQDKEEIQTMMLAFLSNVNEEHILNGTYLQGEEERVRYAADVLERSPLWIECIPNFSMQDIENIMKRQIQEHGVCYIGYDYLMTSLKILEEITKKSGGVKLREDNILFMISTRLKDLANQYGVFILTATQLSGDWRTSSTPDQNLLRGAKSIGDKCDVAMILLPVNPEDLIKLQPILDYNKNFVEPNMKISIYKNRRGRYKGVYLWARADLGTCRIHPQFMTDWTHELKSIEDIKVIIDDNPPWEINK